MPGNGSRDRDGKGKDKALIMHMSHSRHSLLLHVVSSSEIKNVMRYMFVFEVNIPIAVSS